MLFALITAMVLVASITAAVVTQRWAAQRRLQLSDDRMRAIADAKASHRGAAP